jgi:hypothetical protein
MNNSIITERYNFTAKASLPSLLLSVADILVTFIALITSLL